MIDSEKATSSAGGTKAKTSLLDDEIGKEFLTSWKSMSVTEDETMDFQFDTVTKGNNKKAFSFGKLDMDFSLDDNFEKISSFKVDVPDLDFPFATKKTGKAKERSEESSSEIHGAKQDHFNFSFDFNDFNFDSSVMDRQEKSNKFQDNEGIASDKIKHPKASKHAEDDITTSSCSKTELLSSESETTMKATASVGVFGNSTSIVDNPASNPATTENQGLVRGDSTSIEKTLTASAEYADQQHDKSEAIISEPHTERIHDGSPIHPEFQSDQPQNNVTVCHLEVRLPDTNENTSSCGEQTTNAKTDRNCFESSLQKNSPSSTVNIPNISDGENKAATGDKNFLGRKDRPEQLQSDSEAPSVASVIQHEKAHNENYSSNSKHLLAQASRDKPVNENIIGAVKSRFFKRSEELELQPHQVPSTCSTTTSQETTRIGRMLFSPVNQKRNESEADDAKIGSKAVESLCALKVAEGDSAVEGKQKSIEDLGRLGQESIPVQVQSNLIGFSAKDAKVGRQNEPSTHGSINEGKNAKTFGQSTICTQKSVNPKLLVSSMATKRNSTIFSVKGTTLSSLKNTTRLTDLSSFKVSRNVGVKNDPSSSTLQKQTKSVPSSEPEKEVQRNVDMRKVNSVSRENQTNPVLSLKRKTFEEANLDMLALNPSKRLSESPKGSRKFMDTSAVIDEEVGNNASMVDTKKAGHEGPECTWDIPMASTKEVEIPYVMENDGNVENAEACTKELDNICSMLKKKHDEAKELLVRAIVNNNNLLMLNHPIYEEKFQTVQKFAAQLMSKELRT